MMMMISVKKWNSAGVMRVMMMMMMMMMMRFEQCHSETIIMVAVMMILHHVAGSSFEEIPILFERNITFVQLEKSFV